MIEAATRIEDAIYNGTHGSQVKEADPKGKKIALGGTSKNSEVNILSDGKPKTLRTFTPFGITLSRALENKLKKHASSCQYKHDRANIVELVVSDSLLITPAGEKGETDGRDMTGIQETDEIEPPPQVHMLWWDDFNDQFPTPPITP